MKRHDIVVRSAILLGVAVVSLLLLAEMFRRPVYSGSFWYPTYGVGLFLEMQGVIVKVDDRIEQVPRERLASSAIYQEAIARIPTNERPKLTEVRWRRGARPIWIALVALTWWILFRVWQPRRSYLEGGPIT